jgi:integrase
MNKIKITDSGEFYTYLLDRMSASTAKLYCSVINEFALTEPDLQSIDPYNVFLLNHAYKKRSYYYYYAILSFIRFKIEDMGLKNSLIKNLIRPKYDPPIKNTVYITPKKREQVIEKIQNPLYKMIFKLQYNTGARFSDIIRIKRGAITYETFQEKVGMKLNIIGKGGKRVAKWIFDKKLQTEIIDFIRENHYDDEYYFLDFSVCKRKARLDEWQACRTNYHWAWIELKKALYECGVDPKQWSTHDFRRNSAADVWTDEIIGKDIKVLKSHLGHSRVDTTLRYIDNMGLDNKNVALRMAQKSGKTD